MTGDVRDVKRIARRVLGPPIASMLRRRRDLRPEEWGLACDGSGRVFRQSFALEDLVATHGSPLHVDDADRFGAVAAAAVDALAPGIVFVAHRHVATTAMLERLAHLGVGTIAASVDEAMAVLDAGVAADRLVVAEPVPSSSSCRSLIELRPRSILVGSAESAERLVAAAGSTGGTIEAGVDIDVSLDQQQARRTCAVLDASPHTDVRLIRLRLDATIRTTHDVSACADLVAEALGGVLPEGFEGPREILLSVDVGCPTTAPIPYVEGRLNRAFGSDLRPPDPAATLPLTDALRALVTAVAERHPGVTVSVEPGPGLISSSQFLLTTVLDVKDDGDVTHVVLDAGINIAEPVTSEYHHLFNTSMAIGPASATFRMVGPICTPADVLYTNWRLPRARVGDVLAIMDTGLGFVNQSTVFSFPRPAVVEIVDGAVAVTRRRETFHDLVARDVPAAPSRVADSVHDTIGEMPKKGPTMSSTRARTEGERDEVAGIRLSVVIPTFRREDLLPTAIASVLDEDIDQMEVIVIDDAPERSAKHVVEAIQDPRVRYLAMPEPTGGRPALVRNVGIEQSVGDVLYFLDDDDAVAPGGLRALLNGLEAHPDAGVAFGAVVCVGPDRATRERYTEWFDWAAKVSRRLRRSSVLTVGVIMFRGTVIINSCCAIRRELAVELGGYDPAIEVYEDVEFFTRGIRRAGHVVVDAPVLQYSTGLPSIIHDLDGDNGPIASSYLTWHSKYRSEHGELEFQSLRAVSKLLPIRAPYGT